MVTIGTNVSTNGNIGTWHVQGSLVTNDTRWLTNGIIGKISNGTIGKIPERTVAIYGTIVHIMWEIIYIRSISAFSYLMLMLTCFCGGD